MQTATSERARIYVDGVPAAITANVENRRDDGLVVTQALPFLRLATPVTGDDGRRSRIARVTIAMDGDVPRLLLELLHDEEPAGPDAVRDEDTIETWTPGVSTRPARTDGTVPYEYQIHERASREVAIGAATPPRLPPAELPVWLRLWRGVVAAWSTLVGRPLPALPRG